MTFFSLGRVVGHPTDGDVLGVVNVGGWWLLVEVRLWPPAVTWSRTPPKWTVESAAINRPDI